MAIHFRRFDKKRDYLNEVIQLGEYYLYVHRHMSRKKKAGPGRFRFGLCIQTNGSEVLILALSFSFTNFVASNSERN